MYKDGKFYLCKKYISKELDLDLRIFTVYDPLVWFIARDTRIAMWMSGPK
jgi:hypothetical protein